MENTSAPRRVVLAVSGASGAIYAVRCLQMLVASNIEVELIYSNAARRVLIEECDIHFDGDLSVLLPDPVTHALVTVHAHDDIGARPALAVVLARRLLCCHALFQRWQVSVAVARRT